MTHETKLHPISNLKIETKDSMNNSGLNDLNGVIKEIQAEVAKLRVSLNRPNFSDVKFVDGFANKEAMQYKQAFNNYLRRGDDSGLKSLENNITTLSNKSNGYIATMEMHKKINDSLCRLSPMRSIARVVQNSSSSVFEVYGVENSLKVSWVDAEQLERQDGHQIQGTKTVIPLHELYAQPRASYKLIEDTRIDLESRIIEEVIPEFSTAEEKAFTFGSGVAEPRGILKDADKIKQIVVPGALTIDSILSLYNSLDSRYMAGAKFLFSREAMQQLMLLKDKNESYLWGNTIGTGINRLLGHEVVISPYMPAVKPGEIPILFGDFEQAYYIVDGTDITVLRDPYTKKSCIIYYVRKTVGAGMVRPGALRAIKIGG